MKLAQNRWTLWLLAAAFTSLACPPTTLGHSPESDGEHSNHEDHTHEFPAAIVLPKVNGPVPWSDKPLLNDPARFQFAIVTDRTGGHRPGIWMKGVRKLNLMRPEFVVSVGDLIEGYTDDRSQVEKEWKEFLGFIKQLDMKFFFVAGNHDLTNPMMHDVWRKHFGPEWYSFDYKGVHFLCLSTEDPDAKLGQKQLEWIRSDLEVHKNARWTLIFLHKPLWAYAEREVAAGNTDRTGWTQVEQYLGDRPRTVFAGHHHSYVQFDRGGMKYYQLATTGGGSRLRGNNYGEFDHFVWLSMERSGPQVTNVMLDGIQPANVVTERSIARFRSFLADARIEVAPILVDDDEGIVGGRIDVRLVNEFDQPISIRGQFDGIPMRGLTLEPEGVELTAGPGKSTDLALELRFQEKMPFEMLSGTTFTASVRTNESAPLVAERVIPVLIDHRFRLRSLASVSIDGKLTEWNTLQYATHEKSPVIGATNLWNGPGDASMKFDVAHDEDNLYVAARVTDDKLTKGDRFAMMLDARPLLSRSSEPRLRDHSYRIRVEAPVGQDESNECLIRDSRFRAIPEQLLAKSIKTDIGYDIEVKIPLSLLKKPQGDAWHSFQVAPLVRDIDEDGEEPCRMLWRGTAEVDDRNSAYGNFVRSGSDE